MFSEMKFETTADIDDPIVTFMQQMIPHHINAVNMAKLILKQSTPEEIGSIEDFEDILWNIINVQNFHIHQFRNYLNPDGNYLGGDDEIDIDDLCFSGENTVMVENRGAVKMADLSIGDMVMVDENIFEPIYSFGHKGDNTSGEFLVLSTKEEIKPLEISPSHMVNIGNNQYVPVSTLKKGDMIQLVSGDVVPVKSIKKVTRKGLYAPFTNSGKIVVNNIVASNYIAYQGSEYLKIGEIQTPFTYQWIAHTFNSVHRLAVMMGFKDETYTEVGVSHWVDLPHKAFQWVLDQNMFVSSVVTFSFVALFGVTSVFELLFKNQVVMCAIMLGSLIVCKKIRNKCS